MGIDKELLDILVCPKCKGDLELSEGEDSLICKTCSLKYPIKEDIPNNWSVCHVVFCRCFPYAMVVMVLYIAIKLPISRIYTFYRLSRYYVIR